MDDEERRAHHQQAQIRAEQAAARVEEAQLERDAIRRAREAVASGDPELVAAAAAELHRVHALHEARAGHRARSSASIRRARRAAEQLLRHRRP